MNGAPSQPATARGEANVDDLDSVMGRFQNWNKTRSEQPPSKFAAASAAQIAPAKKAALAAGARELSYEQALRASSYRRPVRPANDVLPGAATAFPRHNEVAEAIAVKVSPPSPELPTKRKPTAPPTPVPIPIQRSAPKAAKRAEPTRAATKPVAQPITPSTATASVPAPIVPRVSRPAQTQNRTPSPKPLLAFREVLEESAGLATGRAAAVPENKTIALSLRVSDLEQARIQACAARAGLSVSAYLRQCALGVDELRDQVQLALGELQKRDTKPVTPPELKDIPGILSRFASQVFSRMRGRHDYTGLSLR